MKFSEFLKANKLSKKDVEVYFSKKHNYVDSDQPIMMAILRVQIEGQDIFVLSKTAATNCTAKEVHLADLTINYSEELKRYGLVMPIDTVPVDDYW